MNIPDPLPDVLPIGTKIIWGGMNYISLSIGIYNRIHAAPLYDFENCKNLDKLNETKNISFLPERIIWDELPVEGEIKEIIKLDLIIHCSWCDKVIDNGMTLCSSHESKCQIYWDALTDRMKLSYLNPHDALAYDRACVKIFIDNKESK